MNNKPTSFLSSPSGACEIPPSPPFLSSCFFYNENLPASGYIAIVDDFSNPYWGWSPVKFFCDSLSKYKVVFVSLPGTSPSAKIAPKTHKELFFVLHNANAVLTTSPVVSSAAVSLGVKSVLVSSGPGSRYDEFLERISAYLSNDFTKVDDDEHSITPHKILQSLGEDILQTSKLPEFYFAGGLSSFLVTEVIPTGERPTKELLKSVSGRSVGVRFDLGDTDPEFYVPYLNEINTVASAGAVFDKQFPNIESLRRIPKATVIVSNGITVEFADTIRRKVLANFIIYSDTPKKTSLMVDFIDFDVVPVSLPSEKPVDIPDNMSMMNFISSKEVFDGSGVVWGSVAHAKRSPKNKVDVLVPIDSPEFWADMSYFTIFFKP
jgi:hypothetical protein